MKHIGRCRCGKFVTGASGEGQSIEGEYYCKECNPGDVIIRCVSLMNWPTGIWIPDNKQRLNDENKNAN